MFNSSNIPFTIPTTVLYPAMYLPAPSDTPRITGENALNALRVVWKIQDALGFARTIAPSNVVELKVA